MRCYFLRGGQLEGVEMLPRGLSDPDAIARAETQSLKRRSPIDGLYQDSLIRTHGPNCEGRWT